MSTYATYDLINLTDSEQGTSSSNPITPTTLGSVGRKMPEDRRNVQRDSFSDLAGLMKAKKPYTPIPPPTPRQSLSLATNGVQFASRNMSGSNILSPMAKPFDVNGPVAAWMQAEEMTSASQCTAVPAYGHQHMQRPETTTQLMSPYQIDEEQPPKTPSSPNKQPALLPGFQSPPRIDPTDLDEDHDVGAQIGKLRYQNESNRDQKAAMGHTLAQKEVKIKTQQLDIEDLTRKLTILEAEVKTCGKAMGEVEWLRSTMKASDDAHARDFNIQAAAMRDLKAETDRLTKERDAAVTAQTNAGDHVTRAQNLAETLAKCEKIIMELRQKNVKEQMRSVDLEEEIERLQEKARQEDIDDIKEKLSEKSSQCDQLRTQLKHMKQQYELAQSRLRTATNNGEYLRGGAHLVAPNPNSKLPKTIISCSECYAKNIDCDSRARCRNCIEGNAKCARWRCSLKHKLGECEMAPCTLPHDSQGWLVLAEPRPQW